MATPTIRQAPTATTNSSTITVTTGAGTQVGDTLIAVHQTAWRLTSDLVAPSSAQGSWTSIVQTSQGGQADVQLRAWRRRVTASGAQTVSITCPSGASDTNVLMVFVVVGADPNTPIDGTASTNTGNSGAESVGAISPTSAGDMLVAAFGGYGNGVAYTGLSGAAEVTNGLATTKKSTSQATMLAAQALTSAGSTGSRSAEMSDTGGQGWAGLMFAVRGPLATAPTVSAGSDVAEHIEGTAFTRTATENANGATVTARSWTIQAGPTGVGTTIGTSAALSWTPNAPNRGTYTLRYSATNSVGASTDSMQITVVGVPVTASTDAGDVEVEGPAVTATIIPAVRTSIAAGDIAVEGVPVALTKIGYLPAPSDTVVEGATVNVAHRFTLPDFVEVVVEPLPVDVWGRLLPGGVEVEGLPVQVSYGSRAIGGRGGLVAVPPAPTTRFIVQSILTGEFLHWDLPLADPSITYELSGPSSITGSLRPEDPEILDLVTSGMEPWSCWLHVETDGLIRASGILQPYQLDGETYALEAVGPSAYPQGIPFMGELSAIAADPADIVRAIWEHVQSYPDGNINVTVLGSTPIRIGEPEPEEGVEYEEGTRPAGPYKLSWWEGVDSGSEIDNLARQAAFDYVERCEWLPDRSGVKHWIELAYPRYGTRRTDLRFATGENIIGNPIPAEETDDLYASQVILFGKGEGRDVVRGYAGRALRGRLRRVAVIQDATVAAIDRANALAKADLERRQGLLDITDIEVDARHINAQIGSYSVGDDILIDVEIPWQGRVQQWERVLSITYTPDAESVRLQLRRADALWYGGQAT